MAAISKEAYYSDEVLVQIMEQGASGIDVTTDIATMNISGFGRDTDSKSFFGGAKVVIEKPQEDGEVSFDVRLRDTQWGRMFWGGTGSDFTSGSSQKEFRISWLVTDDESVTSAADETGLGSNAYREVYAACRCTGFEPKLEAEGMLEGTITFKLTATDEDGGGNVRIQANEDDAGSLGSLNDYTSSVKW